MFQAFFSKPKQGITAAWQYFLPGVKITPFDATASISKDIDTLLPYEDIQERYLVDKRGCIAAFYEVNAPSADVATADLLIQIQRTLFQMMEGMPEDILQVEIHYATSGDYRDLIARHLGYSGQWPIEQAVRKRRAEFLMREQQNRRLVRASTTMVLVCGPRADMKEGDSIWAQFRNVKPGSRGGDVSLPKRFLRLNEFIQARNTIETTTRTIEDQLARVGITLRPFNSKEVANYFYRLFNPDLAVDQNHPVNFEPNDTPFNDAWLCSDIYLRDNCLKWGDYYHGLVSMNGKPQETTPRAIEILIDGLKFSDYRISLFARRTDREAEIDSLKGKRKRAAGLMKLGMDALAHLNKENKRGDGMGMMNVEARDEIDESNDLISRLRRKKTFLAQIQMAVHLWHKDRRELIDRFDLTASAMSNMGKARPWREAHSFLPVFLATLPGSFSSFQRPQKVEGPMMADLMAIHRGFEGGEEPLALLHNATRGLIGFNFFAADIKAPMAFISGATGSGKSVLANNLIMQHMVGDEKPIVLIIDVGKSYEPFVELMGGKMITFEKDNPQRINPLQLSFSFEGGLQEPSDTDRLRMITCIEVMIGTDAAPQDKSSLYTNLLDQALKSAFFTAVSRAEQVVTLTNVQEALRQWTFGEDERRTTAVAELIDLLAPFCQGGIYEAWFDGPTEIDINSEIVCFDLKDLGDGSTLQKAVIPIIINYINDVVREFKTRRKILVMDELWKLINTSKLAEFVATAWKTFRKENTAVIGVSQNLMDACESNAIVANALLQNTYMWFLMNQGEERNREYAVKLLNLTDGQAEILMSLGEKNELTEDGRVESYREGLMIRRTGNLSDSGRFRVRLLPEERWISTTDPVERTRRTMVLDQCDGDMEKAIEFLATKYPGGLHAKKNGA
jgi:hypothetical protein